MMASKCNANANDTETNVGEDVKKTFSCSAARKAAIKQMLETRNSVEWSLHDFSQNFLEQKSFQLTDDKPTTHPSRILLPKQKCIIHEKLDR